MNQRLAEWRGDGSPAHAGDLLSTAFVLGATDLVEEVRAALRSKTASLTPAEMLVLGAAGGPNAPETPEIAVEAPDIVRRTRRQLAAEPRNPLVWLELARALTVLGARRSADRAMRAALAGAPNDRLVLRSAARLAVHEGDPERAHAILARSPRLEHDPWILAAEVAVASIAKKTSRHTRRASSMLEQQRFSPRDLSELAGAMATEEMLAGRMKFARRLFTRALESPTENLVAQVVWANRRGAGVIAVEQALVTPRAYEAEAVDLYFAGQWETSLAATNRWLEDEPFSSKPAIQGSYVSAVALERYEVSAALASSGLRANPDDFTLHNNLAFALAHEGRLSEATDSYTRSLQLITNDRHRVVAAATGGLIAYRTGSAAEGERLYDLALARARALPDDRLALSVRAFHLLARPGSQGSPDSEEWKVVSEQLRAANYPESIALLERLERRARLK